MKAAFYLLLFIGLSLLVVKLIVDHDMADVTGRSESRLVS